MLALHDGQDTAVAVHHDDGAIRCAAGAKRNRVDEVDVSSTLNGAGNDTTDSINVITATEDDIHSASKVSVTTKGINEGADGAECGDRDRKRFKLEILRDGNSAQQEMKDCCPRLYEPRFGTPPDPATCDPDMDPDSFIKALVYAYLGYKAQTRPALALPESYFPGLNEEHMAYYGVEVVAAVRENNLEAVMDLNAAGFPLACCNRFGESLMHMACRRGYTQIFDFLLNEANVDVRIRDDCGRSPLHDACWNREPQYEIVDALLRRDPALLLVADKRGHTPFAYARREHWGVWRQFLSDRAQRIVRGLDRIEERKIFGGDK